MVWVGEPRSPPARGHHIKKEGKEQRIEGVGEGDNWPAREGQKKFLGGIENLLFWRRGLVWFERQKFFFFWVGWIRSDEYRLRREFSSSI